MQALQYVKKLGEKIAIFLCIAIFFAIIFVAGGGLIIFATGDRCTGSRDIPVGKETTYWDIALREFPNVDPRVSSGHLVDMNGGDYRALERPTIKGPEKC